MRSNAETSTAESDRPAHPGEDVVAWTQEACIRSGVSFEVSDPMALKKVKVLLGNS